MLILDDTLYSVIAKLHQSFAESQESTMEASLEAKTL